MNERTCKGCPASLAGMRADAVWCSPACKMAATRAARAHKARTRSGPSGLQVSYRKAVVLAVRCMYELESGWADWAIEEGVERIMREGLSSRQREILEARER